MSESSPEKVALSPGEFAAIFGKSQTWGYRQLYSGNVKALTGYGRILIPVSEVDRLLSEAGRYLGLSRAAEKQTTAVASQKPSPSTKNNPWKRAVKSRRKRSGRSLKDANANRSVRRLHASQASAIRKMNQR